MDARHVGLLGTETEWVTNEQRYSGDRELEKPLGASEMGLIYVNPEGPNGQPDPLGAARDIKETFARMAMNVVETAALIVGGHTFGKTHGAAGPDERRLRARGGGAGGGRPGLEELLRLRRRRGRDHLGIEVTWTTTPTQWSNNFLENLYGFELELEKSPADAKQFVAKDADGDHPRPDAGQPAAQADDAGHRHRDAGRPGFRRDHQALAGAPAGAR